MTPLDQQFFWMIHLTPLAPDAQGMVDHPSRNLDRSITLGGGVKTLLERCHLAPEQARIEVQRDGNLTLVRRRDDADLAFIWAGPSAAEIIQTLAVLTNQQWLPQTYIQNEAAA